MAARRGSIVSLLLALAFAVPALAQELPRTITTRFDPRVDGFRVENLGDTSMPGGNCWGMSLLSIDAYRRRMAAGGQELAPGYVARQFPSEADAARQAVAGQVSEELNTNYITTLPTTLPAPSDPAEVTNALQRLATTGVPEVLLFEGNGGGHAVVIHGYRDGALQVYDPNFPNETIAWPWDPVTGFGPHPRAEPGNFYSGVRGAAVRSFDQHPISGILGKLEAACRAGEASCLGRYAPVTSTTRLVPGGLQVRGQVGAITDGTARPDKVYLVVNGVPAAAAVPSRFGTFTLPTVAATALRGDGTDVVRVVSQSGDVFAGFNNVTLPPVEQLQAAIAAARPAPRAPSRAPARAPRGPTRGLAGALGGRSISR